MTLCGGGFLRRYGRRVALLLALAVVAVQGAALAHNASHGFRDHDHRHAHDHAGCPVYVYGEHLALSDASGTPVLPPLPPLAYERIVALPAPGAPALFGAFAAARAPPAV